MRSSSAGADLDDGSVASFSSILLLFFVSLWFSEAINSSVFSHEQPLKIIFVLVVFFCDLLYNETLRPNLFVCELFFFFYL